MKSKDEEAMKKLIENLTPAISVTCKSCAKRELLDRRDHPTFRAYQMYDANGRENGTCVLRGHTCPKEIDP